MANNAELKFVSLGPELAKAQASFRATGKAVSLEHFFFVPSGQITDLLRRLRAEGFTAREDESSPGVIAKRAEIVELEQVRRLTREMCDLADKFAADYDGWKIEN